MPKVFDGSDFDIHELEERVEVEPLAGGGEEIGQKMWADLKRAIRGAKKPRKKSLLVAFTSNIVLPGLGSAYIKRGFWGVSILTFNIFFLLIGLSSFNLLTTSFSREPFTAAGYPSFGAVLHTSSPAGFSLMAGLSLFFVALAWAHLVFTVLWHREEFSFVP